jgi:LPXTG-motif cell wall-anchored protein
MLPGKSGTSIVEEIKPHIDTPIIVVSAKDALDTKVNLLLSGADDYMTKPFEIDELVARVAVQIRKHSTDKSETVYHYKDMVLNITEHSISVSGYLISFTRFTGETYTLREEFAPYGYLKAEEIQFTVEDTAEIQSVVMKDEVPTGAIIINKDGEFVTDTTLMKGYVKSDKVFDVDASYQGDDKEVIEFEAAITCTVVEVEAPKGYLLDSTPKKVKFEYKDGKTRVVEYTLEVVNKPTEPKLPQTGDNMNPWVFAVFGLAVVAAGLGIIF